MKTVELEMSNGKVTLNPAAVQAIGPAATAGHTTVYMPGHAFEVLGSHDQVVAAIWPAPDPAAMVSSY